MSANDPAWAVRVAAVSCTANLLIQKISDPAQGPAEAPVANWKRAAFVRYARQRNSIDRARSSCQGKDRMIRKVAAFQLCLVFLAHAHSAEAQQAKTFRIGFLTPASSASMETRLGRFREQLRHFGYVESQNTTLEYRSAEEKQQRLPDLASELIRLKVDVVIAHGVLAALASKRASATTPIVCFACGDVVSTGLVDSLARPRGNITGQSILAPEASGKRVELLKEVVPGFRRLAVLWNATNPVSKPELQETEMAARAGGLELQSVAVAKPD